MAAPAASDAGPPWPSLPLEVWAVVACRAGSVADAWALTATCRELHALRRHPKVQAWRASRLRPVLDELAESVHLAGMWVRNIVNDPHHRAREAQDEENGPTWAYCLNLNPPDDFLSACVVYGVTRIHRRVADRKFFQDLMGPDRVAAMEQDKEAKAELRRLGAGSFVQGGGRLRPECNGSWVLWAVDAVQRAVELVLLHRIPRDVPVPVRVSTWGHRSYQERLRQRGGCRMQPLEDWLGDHQWELGAPLVEALMEALPLAAGRGAWGSSFDADGSASGYDDDDDDDDDGSDDDGGSGGGGGSHDDDSEDDDGGGSGSGSGGRHNGKAGEADSGN